jgi:hypothetical protein
MRAALRLGVPAIIALAVAASIASGASTPHSERTAVRLLVSQPFSVDNAPSGMSGGDLIGSYGHVHQAGKQIGDYNGACTAASAAAAQCQATLTWNERGSLQLAGTLSLASQKNVYSIVGGTGEFRGASGTARLTALNQGLIERVRLRIIG